MAALIAVVILVAVVLLGSNLGGLFTGAANAVANPNSVQPPFNDPCTAATASGDPLPTCDSYGAWSCPTGYQLTLADAEYTCPVVNKGPYGGPTPNATYSGNWNDSGGQLLLPSITGVTYSVDSCVGNNSNGASGTYRECNALTLSGGELSAGSSWPDGNGGATVTIRWVIPETETTLGETGTSTVTIT
jgi:hypothetical protein